MITGTKVEVLKFKVASQYGSIKSELEITDEVNKFLIGKAFIDMKVNTVETRTNIDNSKEISLYYTIIYK